MRWAGVVIVKVIGVGIGETIGIMIADGRSQAMTCCSTAYDACSLVIAVVAAIDPQRYSEIAAGITSPSCSLLLEICYYCYCLDC